MLAVDVAAVWAMESRKLKAEMFNGRSNQWKYSKSVIKFKREKKTSNGIIWIFDNI